MGRALGLPGVGRVRFSGMKCPRDGWVGGGPFGDTVPGVLASWGCCLSSEPRDPAAEWHAPWLPRMTGMWTQPPRGGWCLSECDPDASVSEWLLPVCTTESETHGQVWHLDVWIEQPYHPPLLPTLKVVRAGARHLVPPLSSGGRGGPVAV